jgi:hypothetical protein
MPQKGKSSADVKLLAALACGATVENAARQAGVGVSTAYRRLRNDGFKAELAAAKADMVQRSASMLTAAALESVKTLVTLQAPTSPPAVRLGAAKAVLEIGVRLRESADLEARLAALERKAEPD